MSWYKITQTPQHILEAEELFIPIIDIATNPTIQLNEIRQKRFYTPKLIRNRKIKLLGNEEENARKIRAIQSL